MVLVVYVNLCGYFSTKAFMNSVGEIARAHIILNVLGIFSAANNF